MFTSGSSLLHVLSSTSFWTIQYSRLRQLESFQKRNNLRKFLLSILFFSTINFLSAQDPGAALDFDGVDDRVEITDGAWNDFGSGNFTVECWVKKQAATVAWSNLAALGKWNTGASQGTNEWGLFLTSDGSNQLPTFVVEVGNTTYQVSGTTSLVLDTWYHIAAVREGTTISIYVNGVLENSFTNAGITSINNISGREIILGKIDGFAGHTNMEMDELRIWNIARTQPEIASSKNQELPSGIVNLLANYHFNQGIESSNNTGITQLEDGSGNMLNGILYNFALNGTTSNWVAPGGVTKPIFSFLASVAGREQVVDHSLGNTTLTLNFCPDESLTFSDYFGIPSSNIRLLEMITGGTSNVTYAGGPITVPRSTMDLPSSFFSATYGPYSLASGSSGSIIQTIVPYFDKNTNNMYDPLEDCLGDTITIIYNVNLQQDPVITSQPQDTPVCNGGSGAVLSVGATGPLLSFQWQKFDTTAAVLNFVNITGATNATYMVPGPVTYENRYRVIVFSNFGLPCQDSVISGTAQMVFATDEGLACNKLINISLGEECELELAPDLILEGTYNHPFYAVQVMDKNGKSLGNVINGTFVNKKWDVKVINTCTGNSCWGQIFVEDKLPALIMCRPDTLINCFDTADFTKPPFLPRAIDNCNPNVAVEVIFNEVLPYKNCTTDTIAVRTIRYRAVNATATCERRIYYRKANIIDILIPKNYDGMPGNNLPLSCSYNWETGIKNRYPDPHETGSPYFPGYNEFTNGININNICKIQVTYRDEMTNGTCLGIKVILRRWIIMDWCTRRSREETQVIKIIDDSGPEFEIPTIPSIRTSVHDCASTIIAPPPINVYDCSGNNHYSYKVEFKLDPECNLSSILGTYAFVSGNIKSELITSGSEAGKWRISGLPVGCTWLKYTLSDSCGNQTIKYTRININDGVAPVAVCDEHTVVTLSADGKATVYARSVDDGSHDDCSQVTLKIRRMTPGCNASTIDWTDVIDVCCTDKIVVAELRVTDRSGNSSVCMANVHIQEKIVPVIVCPENITLTCDADTSAMVTGKPIEGKSNPNGGYYYDNCTSPILTWTNSGKLNDCGEGGIKRTYSVMDNAGNTNTCMQTITVRNSIPFSGPSWSKVATTTLEGCINADTDPSKTGKPLYINLSCSKVIATYQDIIFPKVDGVCYRIERKWTVVDWCKFRSEGDTITYRWPGVVTEGVNQWTYTQIINVIDKTKPEVTVSNAGREFGITENTCNPNLTIQESAYDCNPTATKSLQWSYEVRRNNILYKSGNGTGGTLNANGAYEAGSYTITWQVHDQCGNSETKSYSFNVLDRKKPSAYCLGNITTVVMPTSGSVGVNARIFDRGSTDNCFGPLVFSFSNTYPLRTSDSIQIFTCSDFPTGKDTIHRSINMYVWDVSRNTEFCTVKLIIQKNAACNASGSKPEFSVGGNITNEKNQILDVVPVYLTEANSSTNKMHKTDNKGMYSFKQLEPSGAYTLKPLKNDDHLNGISTLDLVMIQQHILGLKSFTSPYQYLAADANGDKKVTAADLTEIRKLILGINAEFSKVNSWKFFNRAQQIAEIQQPWAVSESIYVNATTGDVMDNNFVAVKTGDVNISAKTSANMQVVESRTRSGSFVIDNKSFAPYQKIVVPITSQNISALSGFQTLFTYDDTKLSFKGIIPGALAIEENAYVNKDGNLIVSWFSAHGEVDVNNKILFVLEFESMEKGTLDAALFMNSDKLKSEYYGVSNTEHPLNMTINKLYDAALLEVGQNTPNPFSATTHISVLMPQDGSAQLKVMDNSGKIVIQKEELFRKGKNEFTIQHHELGSPGIYYYEVKSLGQSFMKKLIKIVD